MAHIPLHHKYRPQTFADLVGQEAIATTLTNALRLEKIAPAYLFTGPRGTGKTSSARILAKSLNCMASQVPTAQPCGKCEVCSSISVGAALDIIEIDAASNTGVDNIRELIERAQYAPVQCRYKVYIIDECLTGDSLVLTDNGWMRIDDRTLADRQVLSYNEIECTWEWKQVLRWLDRGEKETLTIKTTQREISCTGNHLIGTDRGWIKAQELKPGMKILSPSPFKGMAIAPVPVKLPAIHSCQQSLKLSNLQVKAKQSRSIGSDRSQWKDLPGGILMMVPSVSAQKEAPPFIYTPKDIPLRKTNLSLTGLQSWAIQQTLNPTKKANNAFSTTTSDSMLAPAVNGWQTCSLIPSHQWHTSLETIESVNLAGRETVYDIEVEDNHNFVANGLLVHNCHMLTTAAFNSLLKTLEEPPAHVVFVLATTDPQRVLPTIISRCQRFDYRRIPVDAMVKHLTYIAGIESIEIAPASVTLIAQIAQGGLRDAESLLDRLSLLDGEITPDRVYDAIGSVPERDLLGILQSIAKSDPESLLDRTRTILERGKEPLTVLQNLAGCYRDLTIAKTAPKRPDLVPLTGETWAELCTIAQTWQLSWILAGQKHLKDSEIQLKHTTQPQLWLEIAILGLLNISTQPSPAVTPSAPPPAPQPVSPPSSAPPSHPTTTTPPPAATSAPPPAATAAPIAPNAVDLTTTWQQVLQQLLPASRDLFKPFGTLISVSAEQAVVAMKSSTMQTIAAGKVPELAKVFSQMFGRDLTVKLEVLGKTQPQPSAALPAKLPDPVPMPPPAPSIEAPVPPPVTTLPVAPVAGEYLTEDEEIESAEDEEIAASTLLEVPVSLAPPAIPPIQQVPTEIVPPPIPIQIEPPDSIANFDESMDFAEPPDSLDIDRAANTSFDEPEDPEIDPLLQVATDNIVKLFNGEIIDRHHELFDKIVGS